MTQSQRKARNKNVSARREPGIKDNFTRIQNSYSSVSSATGKSTEAKPVVSICLTGAFRQSWEQRWLSLLPKKDQLRDSRTITLDVTELVSADLLQGRRYTKSAWSIPEDYRQSVIARLNSLLAPMESEIQSFEHNQSRVQEKKGFFDGLLRAEEIANHSDEYRHSFMLGVRSVHHLRFREEEDYYYSRRWQRDRAESELRVYGTGIFGGL